MPMTSWLAPPPAPTRTAPQTLQEQLRERAADQRRLAKQLEGCSFYGEWPGAAYLRQAALLEAAALQLDMAEPKPKSPAEIAAEAAIATSTQ